MKTYRTLKYERTEYAKRIRKKYEEGNLKERRCNMRKWTIGGSISNTITSVQKDNYILEEIKDEQC